MERFTAFGRFGNVSLLLQSRNRVTAKVADCNLREKQQRVSRNSVNIVLKSNVGQNCISACAIPSWITGWGKCQRPPPLESIENYNDRPQWCIRLVFVLYDVYFHDCESHDSFTIPVFPLWGKVHGRLSAITNANRLHCKNSKKLKKH